MAFTAVVGALVEEFVVDAAIDLFVESVVTDIGTEFLTDSLLELGTDSLLELGTDSFLDLGLDGIYEQVGNFAGDADWFDLSFPGEITDFASDLNLSSVTDGFDINFDEFGDLEGAIRNNGPSPFDSITSGISNITDKITDIAGNQINKITSQIPTSIDQAAAKATQWATNQVVGTVKNTVAGAVNQAVSGLPGGQIIAGTVNSALNTTARSITGTAGNTGYNTRTTNTRVTATGATNVAFDPNYDEFGDLDAAIANNTTGSAADVGYVIRQNDEDGTFYVINENTGAIAASGLTEYEAIITAQDQTVYDAGDSRAVIDGDTGVNVRSLSTVSNNTVFPVAYDDDGNLMPGFQLDEDNNPIFVGGLLDTVGDYINDSADIFNLRDVLRNQQTIRDQRQNTAQSGDWRVRLRLAPNSNYLYNDPNCGPVLWPLQPTDGVIFPYTPSIDTSYKANYSAYDLTHSNYRGYFYQNSYVDAVSLKATFTAQTTEEANYLLAVIHFFRSVTKMFYGQDSLRGSPPPLTYLSGLGDFQFNEHPCVVSQFNYNLPSDVNYIRAQSVVDNGYNLPSTRSRQTTAGNPLSQALQRLANAGMTKGALDQPFGAGTLPVGDPTYVPTKMEISLTLLPMQSRQQVSQQFSVTEFANGNLLKGGFW